VPVEVQTPKLHPLSFWERVRVRVCTVRTACDSSSRQIHRQSRPNESSPLLPFATVPFCSYLLSTLYLCAAVPLCEILGSSHARSCWILVAAVALMTTPTGCAGLRGRNGGSGPIQNPMFIPAVDRELLWNQTVDAVDDYFRIEREDRVRQVGGVLTEGRIDTFPTIGSTLLEPWRNDSTRGYEKLHATFQSIRRRATLRVIPTEGGYLLDVTVQKELEDLDKPENATAGGSTLRHDGTLVRQEGPPGRFTVTLGWIPIGRDISLEQRILADVSGRLDLGSSSSGGWLDTVEQMFLPPGDSAGPELINPASPAPNFSPNIEALPPPASRAPNR
jgi:hypothetical protein